MASEAAADDEVIKQISQELKEKRCGDCRERKCGPQGNWSQNLSAAFKTGIEISVSQSLGSGGFLCGKMESRPWFEVK
jgi:hypothetical protein